MTLYSMTEFCEAAYTAPTPEVDGYLLAACHPWR